MGRSNGRQRGDSVAAYGEIPMAAVTSLDIRPVEAFVEVAQPVLGGV